MKALLMPLMMSFGLLAAAGSYAQAPAAAPAGSTGQCKDGSYTSNATKRGACRGHQGVKEWYAGASSAAANDDTSAKTSRKSKADTETAAAAAPTAAPAGSTGLCRDGSYTSTDTKKGACRGHKGVKEWYGAAAAGAGAAAAAPKSSAPMTPPQATTPATPAPTSMPSHSTAPAAAPETRAAAPGGGAGKVWVNTESKVYHCANDRYYGKTKQGEYMSEADALAKDRKSVV